MIKTNVKLLKREEIATGTIACSFEKPAGFDYKPGQFMYVTLINSKDKDERGNARQLSISSAPYEDHLMIATRVRESGFKKHLSTMPIGEEVEIRGPFGTVTLHEEVAIPAVLLAGGIGITPFRSMILTATHNKSPQKILLFFFNKTPAEAPFLKQLQDLPAQNPNFTLVPVMTQIDETWKGESGYLSAGMLGTYVGDLTKPIFYIAGPPAMVDSMKKTLDEQSIKGSHIHFEHFIGY